VILGGGVAGLASTFAHLERGWHVTLVERRKHLGGRAWSMRRDVHRHSLDNGPHVLLGCYDAFRRLLRALGTEDAFWRPPTLRLAWLRNGGQLVRLRPPVWPAPFHLLAGFLGIHALPLDERFGLLASGLAPFLPLPRADASLAQWMRDAGHPERARELLFDPLCRAVMNDAPERTSARLFLETLRAAFRGDRANSAMWVPTRPWGAILDQPARDLLPMRGVRLLLGRSVRAIEIREPGAAVRLDDRTLLESHDRIVVALPWHAAARLDPERRFLGHAGQLRPAPMLTVYAQLPPAAIPFADPVVALVGGRPFHFLCRRPDTDGRARTDLPTALLAGGSRELDGMPRRAIVAAGLAQLARFLGRDAPWPPDVADHAKVVREAHATIAPAPGIEALRPEAGATAVPGIWLAGDWTKTGLPSTLEGAARSGYDPLAAT